jgi:hypothetical protein
MSSVSTFLSEIAQMSAEVLTTTRATVNQAFDQRENALATEAAKPAPPAAKPAAKRKATKAVKEAELLVPVDAPAAAPAPASPKAAISVTTAADPSDPLKTHPSRLQKIDMAKCMGRKIVISKWVPGTHKDEGGVKKFHPENQCSSAPATGQALCAKCAEQESLAAAGKRDAKKWFGRLDQPLYEYAAVVGCKQYVECYPNGINGDPLSVPPKASSEPAKAVSVPPAAPKKAKKAKAANEVPAAIAMTDLDTAEAEWLTFMQKNGIPAIRNLKTHMVYAVSMTETDRAKMAKMDEVLGKWDTEKGEVDPYGVPDEE